MKVQLEHERNGFLALLICVAVLCSLALSGLAYGSTVSPTLRVLKGIHPHQQDISEGETSDKRDARLVDIAMAIDAATGDPLERAALIVLARRESGLAAYVYENRCGDGPRGERECDSGKAVGIFQLQPNALHPTIPLDVASQAKIAIAMWRYGLHRCAHSVPDAIAGAFDSYATGGGCSPSTMGKLRADEARSLRGRL